MLSGETTTPLLATIGFLVQEFIRYLSHVDPNQATPGTLDIECEYLITGDLVGMVSAKPHVKW